MRTVTFQSIYEAVLIRHGFDPAGDAVTHDTARAIAEHITERAQTAWVMWPFPELTRTEERAYRQVWNSTVQYRRVGADGLADELYYMVDQKYYKVRADLSGDPPIGMPPTNTTYFALLDPVSTFVARDQRYKRPLGQTLGVYATNPSLNGCCSHGLDFYPSEQGTRICNGPLTTVFIQHQFAEPQYTIKPYVQGKAYVKGDLVFYEATGECYRSFADNNDHIPTDTAFWSLIPVPAMFSTYLKEGAYADCLIETNPAGEDQIRLARAAAADKKATESIQGLIDDLMEQGQKFHYIKPRWGCHSWSYDGTLWWSQGRVCHSDPWTGDRVYPLTDTLDTMPPPVPPSPPPLLGHAPGESGITLLTEGQDYVDVVFTIAQPRSDWKFIECRILNTADASPLNIWPGIISDKTKIGFRLELNGIPDSGNYYLDWAISGATVATAGVATSYLFSGPTSGQIALPSTFVVALPTGTTLDEPITITPDDGGAGGTFTPSIVQLSTEIPSANFTYTPVSYGTKIISVNDDSGMADPAMLNFTVVASTYLLTGPGSGGIGAPSTNFTVALPTGGAVTSVVTVIPSDNGAGGTFTPTSVALTTVAPSATFTYTPASTGTKTISTTNNRGLTDPANISYDTFAPTYSLSGPSVCTVGVPSSNFTVVMATTPVLAGTVVITPNDSAGGTFTPATVSLTTAAPSATFTYTSAASGTRIISVTNNRGLDNPANLVVEVAGPLVDGQLVGIWPDSSGHAHDATQTGSARPTFKTNILNSKPVVRFTSAGLSGLNIASPFASGLPWCAFAVMKPATPTSALFAISGTGFSATAIEDISGNFYFQEGINYHGFVNTFAGGFHIFATLVISTASYCFVDGTDIPLTLGGPSTAGNFSCIGWRSADSAHSNGDIAELLFYNVPLLGADILNISTYLGAKYAITVAGGGTIIDPSSVSGLVGWWKADSLL
jgi:hypothetical protein